MKNLFAGLAVAAVSISACSTEAANFKTSKFGSRVYPHAGNEFEVVPRIGSDLEIYWCAASDYARRYLGAGWQTPIYVSRSIGPGEISGRRSTVLFTLDPVAPTAPQRWVGLANSYNVRESRTVQAGDGNCDPYFFEF